MNSEVLEHVTIWFHNHVETYLPGPMQLIPVIQDKIEHSRYVAANCRSIANELQWPSNDIIAAEVLGLLHDIGRFSQFAEFGTFIDEDSINHGERGYNVVSGSLISPFISSRYRQMILEGIRFHNTKSFRSNVHKKSIPFLKLIRDADKLDKIRIALESVKTLVREQHKPALTLYTDGPVTNAVLRKIQKNQTVPKKHVWSTVDFCLMRLSLVFDIHYLPTYKHLYASNILESMSRLLPDDEAVRTASISVLAYLKAHVQGSRIS